jgi:hypothetical protein
MHRPHTVRLDHHAQSPHVGLVAKDGVADPYVSVTSELTKGGRAVTDYGEILGRDGRGNYDQRGCGQGVSIHMGSSSGPVTAVTI